MSNEIDNKLWRIQEQALKSSATNLSLEEQAEIKEYQELYQTLELFPAEEPPSVLAQTVSRKIAMRHRKQYTGKLFTAGLCLLLIMGLFLCLVFLLPQSVLLTEVSQLIPLPMITFALALVILVNLIRRN
ncbi:MAG TPA: hypothetical protein VIM93_03915 [Kangiella sp.]